jgi:hypothetical protein
MVIPIISIACCRSKKKDKDGESKKAFQQQSQKKLSSESKLSGSKKSAEKKKKKGRKSKLSINPSKTSEFKSNFEGVHTALTLESGAKKSLFLPIRFLKSSGKDETTAKSFSKPTTKSTSFSKRLVLIL